jgi:hypothetical protein
MLPTLVETMAYLAPLTTTSEVDPGTPLGVQLDAVAHAPLVLKVDVAAHPEGVSMRKIEKARMKYPVKCFTAFSLGFLAKLRFAANASAPPTAFSS